MSRLFIILAALSAGSLALAQEIRPTRPYKVEMEMHLVRVSGVPAIEIMVDYEKVPADCNGLSVSYSQVENKKSQEIFVTKQAVYTIARACPLHESIQTLQGGIKFRVKANPGQNFILKKVYVPAGSNLKVSASSGAETGSDFVCKKSVNCMPPLMTQEAIQYCSQKYMDWAAQNCPELPVQLQ